jgi:N6-L-threonylcarbamoyladenine synthase
MELCTDNAAMIAMAGYLKYNNNSFSSLEVVPIPRLSFN